MVIFYSTSADSWHYLKHVFKSCRNSLGKVFYNFSQLEESQLDCLWAYNRIDNDIMTGINQVKLKAETFD